MRGALKPIDGVSDIQISVGEPKFKVTYDEKKVAVDDLLAALDKAGEPAKKSDS